MQSSPGSSHRRQTTAVRDLNATAWGCFIVALVAVAASMPAGVSAQSAVCPSLTMNNHPSGKQMKAAILQACSTNTSFVASPATCGPCQCALISAVAPLLQDSGDILPVEMYTANAVKVITGSIKNCSREFALQLLEAEAGLKLSHLLTLEGCAADEKTTIQCMSQPIHASTNVSKAVTASSAATAKSTGFGNPADGSNTINEILRDASCALAAAGRNNTGYADNCSSSVPATSSWIVMAPSNTDPTGQGLTISSSNSRGPVAWKAGCWCDDSYDPVCDSVTRKQYPNSCSAKCQFVAQTVPCSSLSPLIQKSQIPGAAGTPINVYDESMVNTNAVAFQGPVPPAAPLEADKSTQMFYYYYDDDVDDSQDAAGITAGFYKAMAAGNYGEKTSNAAVLSKSVAAAITAAAKVATAKANTTVKGLDGASDNSTGLPGVTMGIPLLDSLKNSSGPIGIIARLREGTPNSGGLFRNASGGIGSVLSNATQAARGAISNSTANERRSSVSVNVADQPALPAWLSTKSPDQAAGIYTRKPERTSRILAALQATAKQAGNEQQAAAVVMRLAPGLQGFIEGVTESVTAQSYTPALDAMNATDSAPAPTGGLFRGALANNTLANFRSGDRPILSALNVTGERPFLSALNATLANTSAALANNSATPVYNAISFDQMMENLGSATSVRDLLPSQASAPAAAGNRSSSGNSTSKPVAAFRGAGVTNMTANSNTTAGNSTQVPVKAASGPNKAKQNAGRRLLTARR